MDLLECPLCLFLMCEPVTMSCGHTFCRRCVGGYLPSKCPLCKERLKQREVKSMKNNVLLISVVEKCRPDETKMKCHILEKLKTDEFTEALRIADEGLDIVPDDQSLKVYRAEANFGMMRFSDALSDLDYLCRLRPNWTEGFFRKGNVLLEMGQQTEALIQFHRCLNLQADFVPAKSQIKKILEAGGVAVPDEVPCILQVVSEYLKEPCPITSLSGSQGPTRPEVLKRPPHGDEGEGKGNREAHQGSKVKHDSGTECCLSLCQAVSFLPAAEEDEEMMMRKEDGTWEGKYNPTALLQDIMTQLFPSQLAERKQVHDAEMAELSNLTKDIPIFVCTVAYPGVPCPLHIFEPRYRLMMRRCMETGH
ncbi:LON peptidase N-terminal domain and RING finger protein 2 [Larimichthys crocea]|uniref:Uncharacterized protein n=1 Tax=Larimichthys crocea TaxID=215358 RepID=A0ACD3REQ4_LARCR|nr:LON peptidase N-terminal domain and RING finger protein 2 [Larimichthys crocea]